MKSLLQAEFLKIKRKGFWLLTILGALGVVALQMVNYGVRKEYLLKQSEDHWVYYLENIHTFTPLVLVLGVVILTSMMASIEDETHAWKQILSLPISKTGLYLTKFTVLAWVFFVFSSLLMLFTLAYGIFLRLGEEIPYLELVTFSYYPYLAALPILALQLWVATVSKNQGIPITVGVVGVILTYSAFLLPDWVIWKWPTLTNEWNQPMINVLLGMAVGCLLYVVGMFDFKRRDVK